MPRSTSISIKVPRYQKYPLFSRLQILLNPHRLHHIRQLIPGKDEIALRQVRLVPQEHLPERQHQRRIAHLDVGLVYPLGERRLLHDRGCDALWLRQRGPWDALPALDDHLAHVLLDVDGDGELDPFALVLGVGIWGGVPEPPFHIRDELALRARVADFDDDGGPFGGSAWWEDGRFVREVGALFAEGFFHG